MKSPSEGFLSLKVMVYLLSGFFVLAVFFILLNFILIKKREANKRRFSVFRDRLNDSRSKYNAKSSEVIANGEFEFVLTDHSTNSMSSRKSRLKPSEMLNNSNLFIKCGTEPRQNGNFNSKIKKSITEQYIHELNEREKLNGARPSLINEANHTSSDFYENMTSFFHNLKESQA